MFFSLVIIAAVSVIWALLALKKERDKKEIEKAKEDMAKGRVIFHSEDIGDSSSS